MLSLGIKFQLRFKGVEKPLHIKVENTTIWQKQETVRAIFLDSGNKSISGENKFELSEKIKVVQNMQKTYFAVKNQKEKNPPKNNNIPQTW